MVKPLLMIALLAGVSQAHADTPVADDARVTILVDSVISGDTRAEWGFSAWVEVKEGTSWRKILFDTGGSPDLAIKNAEALNINLCEAEDVVLSHHHDDHTSGLIALRKYCARKGTTGIRVAHVGSPEIFSSRLEDGKESNILVAGRKEFERLGGSFEVANGPAWLSGYPGVFVTGKIPRLYDEKSYPAPDTIPEDQALGIVTSRGLVLLSGCGHAGIVNTSLAAMKFAGAGDFYALIGGFHLFRKGKGSKDETGSLLWTAEKLKELKIKYILGGHCTGFEQLLFLRSELGLTPETAVISSVQTRFEISRGVVTPMPGLNGKIRD
jgi:7,8-dihydropterin-6-yl-methyl-4-(beta-D-ribofuranosyl)aminobenzene 5'-phosphate synthase